MDRQLIPALQRFADSLHLLGIPADACAAILLIVESVTKRRDPPQLTQFSDSLTLDQTARNFYRASRSRESVIGPGIVSDPAWHMMLDLVSTAETGNPATVSSLCAASGVSSTTALRHMQRMEERGLIVRRPVSSTSRRVYVEPTDRTITTVRNVALRLSRKGEAK